MARENITQYAILGLLHHESMTGYDLKKRIDSSVSYFWSAGYGQIYPTLKTMQAEGLITNSREAKNKGPERILYSIADPGRDEMLRWLESGGEKEYVRYEILLKLFFGSGLPTEQNIRKIRDFRDRNASNLEMMNLYTANLQGVLDESKDHTYFYLTTLFGAHTYQAYIDWADEAIRVLEKMEDHK